MFAYCNNNPVNSVDPTGESTLGILIGKAVLGAAVNVLTTYIGAKATGQSYSWKDAACAATSGALGTGGTVSKIIAGVVSGVYSGYMAYKNGATAFGALASGVVSAVGTTVSVANIAGWTGTNLSTGVSTVVDIIFGTSANTMAAVTYRVSTDSSLNDRGGNSTERIISSGTNRTKTFTEQLVLN